MPITKLNEQQAQQTLNTKGIGHVWVESKDFGTTYGILCYEREKDTNGKLETLASEFFGVPVKINGAVSPPDREENTDQMYMVTFD